MMEAIKFVSASRRNRHASRVCSPDQIPAPIATGPHCKHLPDGGSARCRESCATAVIPASPRRIHYRRKSTTAVSCIISGLRCAKSHGDFNKSSFPLATPSTSLKTGFTKPERFRRAPQFSAVTSAFDDLSRPRYDKLWRISVLRVIVSFLFRIAIRWINARGIWYLVAGQ